MEKQKASDCARVLPNFSTSQLRNSFSRMPLIYSPARAMRNANAFTNNCQGESGPGRSRCAGHSFNKKKPAVDSLQQPKKPTVDSQQSTAYEKKEVDRKDLLAVGCWLLAVGCGLLAVGCWLLGLSAVGFGCSRRRKTSKRRTKSVNSKSEALRPRSQLRIRIF